MSQAIRRGVLPLEPVDKLVSVEPSRTLTAMSNAMHLANSRAQHLVNSRGRNFTSDSSTNFKRHMPLGKFPVMQLASGESVAYRFAIHAQISDASQIWTARVVMKPSLTAFGLGSIPLGGQISIDVVITGSTTAQWWTGGATHGGWLSLGRRRVDTYVGGTERVTYNVIDPELFVRGPSGQSITINWVHLSEYVK